MTSSKLPFKDVIDTFLVPGDKNFLAYPNKHNSVKQAGEKRKKSSIFVQKKIPTAHPYFLQNNFTIH